MAVEENYRGRGIGSLIISELEKRVRETEATKIVINSHDKAVEFYKKHGYEVINESYNLYGEIPHFKMLKIIRDTNYLKICV